MRKFHNLSVHKIALTAGLISFLVFLRAISGDFVNHDDNRFVLDNPGIRNLDASMIFSALTEQFSDDYWTPLTWISFAIDYHFWGLNPVGYHLVNIILHAVNTMLVVLITDRLWNMNVEGENRGPFGIREESSSDFRSYLYPVALLLAGLLWGLHPLRVESVAWVAERKDVLYGMLAFCSILFYIRDVQNLRITGNAGRRFYFISLLFFQLALMAKPTSVFIPMLLVVADWYPFRRLEKGALLRPLAEKIPFFILSALATVITINKMSITSAPYTYDMLSFTDRVLISGHSIVAFCRLLLFPTEIHVFNTLAKVLADPVSASIKTAMAATFTCFCLYMVRKKPYFIVGWLSFLIPLLPTLPFFQVGVDVAYSTRHSYLPSVVPSMMMAAMIVGSYKYSVTNSYRFLSYMILFLTAGFLTFNIGMDQVLINSWKNSGTLWSRAIKFNPVGRAYLYRAMYYMETRQYLAAADDYLVTAGKAEQVRNPEAFNYYAIGGDIYKKEGQYEKAVLAFTSAIRLYNLPVYHYHRGLALQALGKLNDAAEDFRKAGAERGDIVFLDVP